MTIATNVVSSIPSHGEVYSIQYYIIKFVRDFRWVSPVSSTDTSDRQEITEILLKVALNTLTLLNLEYAVELKKTN